MAPRLWRNRIVGHGEEDAEQLLANPANFRIHPREQQDALQAVLGQVGWVQQVIVNQRTGFVVDGHARVAMAISAGERVPVVYVDLTAEEEKLILASYDRLGGMAGVDHEKLNELIADATEYFPEMDDVLAVIAGAMGDIRETDSGPPSGSPAGSDAEEAPNQPVIQYNIIFDDMDQQRIWFAFLKTLRIKWPELRIAERLVRYIEAQPAEVAE